MLLQPRLGQPPWAEEAGSFGPTAGGEEQEKSCHGCKPGQSQGSGLPACTKQGGLFQLTNPWNGLSSLPILSQNLPSHFCAWAGGSDSGVWHARALRGGTDTGAALTQRRLQWVSSF